MKTPKTLSVLVLVVGMTLTMASPAAAHDPIFITDDQTSPDTGPYMPDGTISWALYGTVLEAGETRGFEFDLRDGDELYVSLLIPNLEPELSLSDEELPVLELETPDGETMTIAPEIREVFDEPFSSTSYITLAELREPATGGRYRGTVIGNAPSRFTIAVGEREIFFTEAERTGDRPSTFPGIAAPLNAWYSTAPGEEPPADASSDVAIQTDMIDEAMESGVASTADDAEAASDSDSDSDDGTGSDEDSDGEEAADVGVDDDDSSGLTNVALPAVLVAAAVAGLLVFRRRQGGPDPADQA